MCPHVSEVGIEARLTNLLGKLQNDVIPYANFCDYNLDCLTDFMKILKQYPTFFEH